MATKNALRQKALALYKNLMHLAREYPGENGPEKFRKMCRETFICNKNETNPQRIKALIAKGNYTCKEVEALYALKKYRAMKKRYDYFNDFST